MSGKRYTDKFKIEAVRQVTERGHSVAEVADRLGITTHSLYAWKTKFGQPDAVRRTEADQSAEVRRLKAELKRVTEERDILKKPRRTSPRGKSEVRVHAGTCPRVSSLRDVPGARRAPQWLLRVAVSTGQCTSARGRAPAGSDQALLAGQRRGVRASQDHLRFARGWRAV